MGVKPVAILRCIEIRARCPARFSRQPDENITRLIKSVIGKVIPVGYDNMDLNRGKHLEGGE